MKIACCSFTGTKHVVSSPELMKTVDFLKVIAEENRLKILCLLQKGDLCVCDIWQYLGLPQNLTSHHLKVLKDFGLITSRKEGLRVHYSIDKKTVHQFNHLLSHFLLSYGKEHRHD
jgi:ArsR family transcriptional regulator